MRGFGSRESNPKCSWGCLDPGEGVEKDGLRAGGSWKAFSLG